MEFLSSMPGINSSALLPQLGYDIDNKDLDDLFWRFKAVAEKKKVREEHSRAGRHCWIDYIQTLGGKKRGQLESFWRTIFGKSGIWGAGCEKLCLILLGDGSRSIHLSDSEYQKNMVTTWPESYCHFFGLYMILMIFVIEVTTCSINCTNQGYPKKKNYPTRVGIEPCDKGPSYGDLIFRHNMLQRLWKESVFYFLKHMMSDTIKKNYHLQ